MGIGSMFGSSDDEAQDYLKQALQQYQAIKVPTAESGKVESLPEESVQGVVTPDEIHAVDQDPSAYNNIKLDPASRQAMMTALQGYSDLSDAGGLDANAKLGIQQVLDAANRQSQGAQGAIQNQAQAMGRGGGDFALTQRAIAAQGASNNAATQGLQEAAMAEANREAALSGMAQLGGQINASDFSQEAQKASAQNAINATNQSYQNNANVGNVANRMLGDQFNVSTAQNVNAANTSAKQNNAYYNANLPQQQFNNELAKANGSAGVSGQQANAANQASANQAAMTGKLIGAAGQIAGAYYGGGASGSGAPAGNTQTNASIASTPGYQRNAANNNPAFAHGGVVCYANGGVSGPHDHTICMQMGGHVGGEAEVPGDSEHNDTVPALLSPGELVIPRSVPKTGPAMEQFARQAPVAGTDKKVDLTSFTKGYRKSR